MAKEISNIAEYVVNLVNEKGAKPKYFKKFVRVMAEQGKEGEVVATIMANGHQETINMVKVDEMGNADWIVTNPSGERYIVPHAKFIKRYEVGVGQDGKHAPIGKAIKVVQIDEDIAFKAPWGEDMEIKAGGFLNITNQNDIYGIQKEEFEETYAPCDKNGVFKDDKLKEAFGQERNK